MKKQPTVWAFHETMMTTDIVPVCIKEMQRRPVNRKILHLIC